MSGSTLSGKTAALVSSTWRTGVWRLLPMYVAVGMGIAAVYPVVPELVTDFWASQKAGHPMRCQQYAPGAEPDACRNAHATAVTWTAWTSFVSNTVLAFLFAPMVGDWSDRYGRKPFLLLGLALNLAPILVLLAYTYDLLPLYWYYPANATSGALSSITVALAYVADCLDACHRASVYGLIIAAFALGFLLGPLLGAFLQVRAAMWCGTGLIAGCMLYAAALLPETVVRRVEEAAEADVATTWTAWMAARRQRLSGSVRKTFGIMARDRTFLKLSVCNAIVGLVGEGVMDLLSQYLQLKVGFTTRDQGLLLMVLGVGSLVVQGAVITPLVHLWGEQRLLLVGLAFYAVEYCGLAAARTKGAAFLALGVGCMGSVSFPAISSIKSNNAAASEQGLVQGALVGTRSLAQGVGPLLFASLFAACTRTDSPLGYFPAAPFLVCVMLMGVAFAVASTIRADAGRPLRTEADAEHGQARAGDEQEALLSRKDMEEAGEGVVANVGGADGDGYGLATEGGQGGVNVGEQR